MALRAPGRRSGSMGRSDEIMTVCPSKPSPPRPSSPAPSLPTSPGEEGEQQKVELTRIGGHLILWEKGVHDAPTPRSVPPRVSAADGGSRPRRTYAGGAVARVRAVSGGDPELGAPE